MRSTRARWHLVVHSAPLLTAFLLLTSLGAPRPAHAQQALPTFLAVARERALDLREARAAIEQARAQVAEARGRLLPSLVGTASYQRNSPVVSVTVPTGMADAMGAPITRQAVITPADQYGAVATASVPLIDLSAWSSLSAAGAKADAAEASEAAAAEGVAIAVVELWYRLVGQRALVAAAEQNLTVTRASHDAVAAQVEVGVAGQLELARAQAELSRAEQTLSEARLQASLAARALADLTGLTPDDSPATVILDAGAPVAPLGQAQRDGTRERPSVKAAQARQRAADLSQDSAWLALLPTIAANGSARWNNAAGFGRKDSYFVGVSATWALDFVKPARIGTAAAGEAVAEVQSERAEQQALSALLDAWERVQASRVSLAASLAAKAASERAAQDAQARYDSGTATQLDLIGAQRDAFQANVASIGAAASLHVARAVLAVRNGDEPVQGGAAAASPLTASASPPGASASPAAASETSAAR